MAWHGTRVFGVVVSFTVGSGVGWVANNLSKERRKADMHTTSMLLASSAPSVLQHPDNTHKTITLWNDNWDRRDPKSLVPPAKLSSTNDGSGDNNKNTQTEEIKKVTPTATRHLLLIRHGQYNLNADHDSNRYLTQLGIDQADMTGKRLKQLDLPYDIVISSTLTRARQTAKLISQHMPDVKTSECELLCEGAPFPPEPPLAHWKPDYKQFQDDGARIEAAFRRYFHRASPKQKQDSYELVVCHANVIRYFVCRALQLPPEAWLRMSLNHGSITWVAIRPSGRVVLRSLGDSGHLPPDMITTS